ncbi:MAG: DNA (cytosine-5-)-methyltransferase, partial [Erysipelothrix sp.]|nr:DNA (cytosine-5-)-methyltransferase [Erysipelothrix sp.]
TESRRKIKRENPHIIDENGIDLGYVRTITTKQDRHPNSGIIVDQISTIAPENKSDFRYLSPRECFLLMGFDESDFDKLIENNFMVNNARYFFTSEKLIKMAGNSIVVDILEEVFKQMLDIKKRLEENF